MRTLFTHIKQLVQTRHKLDQAQAVRGKEMAILPQIENAWLLIENNIILDYGTMEQLPENIHADKTENLSNRIVLPMWCDSHTHLVFSHSRELEFIDRIHGLSYEEIAKRGGGILNSARRMQEISEAELYYISLSKLEEVKQQGTGAIEIKSGYGLSVAGELKMLRVIRKLKENSNMDIKASFLGAHAFPLEYKENHDAYIQLIIEKMLPQIADEGLADYIDVFCERGFFNVDETDRILTAGAKYGLKPKIHANQLYNIGGVQIGVKHNAISVDHLETMDDEEVNCLRQSNTMPTLLPGAAFFLAMHYQPARKLIDAGLPVALATDYNPGSCPSGNMNLILSLACTQMKMTPEEAINACTMNGAIAMELQDILGCISIGKKAKLIITKPISSLAYLPYSFGSNCIERVVI